MWPLDGRCHSARGQPPLTKVSSILSESQLDILVASRREATNPTARRLLRLLRTDRVGCPLNERLDLFNILRLQLAVKVGHSAIRELFAEHRRFKLVDRFGVDIGEVRNVA